MRAYIEIRQALEQAAGRTNGRFADTDWTPIRYLNRNFPHATLMGLLRAANVGLVTPLRDGMNLVAKEYVAAQDAEDPGVLILSNLAGAARELTAALLVNPYDTRAVGHAIQAALSMPLPERRERHAAMMQVLKRNDIAAWTRRFVDALEQAQRRKTRACASSARSLISPRAFPRGSLWPPLGSDRGLSATFEYVLSAPVLFTAVTAGIARSPARDLPPRKSSRSRSRSRSCSSARSRSCRSECGSRRGWRACCRPCSRSAPSTIAWRGRSRWR